MIAGTTCYRPGTWISQCTETSYDWGFLGAFLKKKKNVLNL